MIRNTVLLALLIFSSAASAITIVRAWPPNIVGTNRDDDDWEINDYYCLQNENENIACGQVVRVTEKGLILSVASAKKKVSIGMEFDLKKMDFYEYRESGLFRDKNFESKYAIDYRLISVGFNYLLPFVQFEQGLSRNFALGFMPTYLSLSVGNGRISGVGYILSLGYFFDKIFRGFYVHTGLGIYTYTEKVGIIERSTYAPAAQLAFGYKYRVYKSLTLSLAGGGQYLLQNKDPRANLAFSGFLPMIVGSVGISF